jgi:hypothetical protein
VKAVCGEGNESAWSAICNFTTTAIPICAAPVNVAIIDTTAATATVSWVGHQETSWTISHKVAGTTDYTEATVTVIPYVITGLTNGTPYEVCVVAHCDEANSEKACITFTTPTGIPEVALNNNVKLYPNPATTLLSIEMTTPFQKFEITNLLGQVIYTSAINTNVLQVDVSDYTSGVYFVKLQGKDGVVTKKFVKR